MRIPIPEALAVWVSGISSTRWSSKNWRGLRPYGVSAAVMAAAADFVAARKCGTAGTLAAGARGG